MADAIRHTGLHSQDNLVESLGHAPNEMRPSSTVQDVNAPGADRILALLANNQLPLIAGTSSQASKTVENNSRGTVAYTDNPSASTETPIDAGTLVQHPEHGHMPPSDADNVANSVDPQNGSFEDDSSLLNASNGALPIVHMEDAEGELLHNQLDPPLNEDEEESDQDDYGDFTPAELQLRLQEYNNVHIMQFGIRETMLKTKLPSCGMNMAN